MSLVASIADCSASASRLLRAPLTQPLLKDPTHHRQLGPDDVSTGGGERRGRRGGYRALERSRPSAARPRRTPAAAAVVAAGLLQSDRARLDVARAHHLNQCAPPSSRNWSRSLELLGNSPHVSGFDAAWQRAARVVRRRGCRATETLRRPPATQIMTKIAPRARLPEGGPPSWRGRLHLRSLEQPNAIIERLDFRTAGAVSPSRHIPTAST